MEKKFMNKYLYKMPTLIEKKENIYFWLCAIISVLIYAISIISIVGLIYILFLAIFLSIAHCISIAHIKSNSVKVTKHQFSEIYTMLEESCSKLELPSIPDTYILQSGGVLNAFATKFLGKQMVVLYSDVIELANAEGVAALKFIITHELVHHKRNHVSKHILLAPSLIIPFLSQAYSRACEYTCDAISADIYPQKATNGLCLILLGSKLYNHLDLFEYITTSQTESGFWSWSAEIVASHPHLYKRISRIYNSSIQNIETRKPIENSRELAPNKIK